MTFQVGDHVIEKKYPWITYKILGFNEKSGKAIVIEIQWSVLFNDTNWYTPSSMSSTELPISDLFRAAKFRTIDNLICKDGRRCKPSVSYYRYDNWHYEVWFPDEKRGCLLPEEDLSFATDTNLSTSNTSNKSMSMNSSMNVSLSSSASSSASSSSSSSASSSASSSSSSSSSASSSASSSSSSSASSSLAVIPDFDETIIQEAIEQSKITAEEYKKKQAENKQKEIEEYERKERELAEKAALFKQKQAIIFNNFDNDNYDDDNDDY